MASTISDKHLRLLTLKLDDAYDQRDIITELPSDVGLLDIINIYSHKKYPEQKVYCPACKGHRHRNGFTAVLNNGKRVLLGSTCGSRIFGESWRDAEKRIGQQIDRQYELIKADRAKLALPHFLKALRRWHHPLDCLTARRTAFRRRFGYLWSALQDVRNTNGHQLFTTRRIRDYSTEDRHSRNGNDSAVAYRYEHVPAGILHGAGFFDDIDIINIYKRALDAGTEYLDLVHNTQDQSTRALRKARMRFDEAASRLDLIREYREDADAFFEPRNLQTVISWANAQEIRHRDAVYADGSTLRCEHNASVLRVDDLAELDSSALDLLAEYRRAD